MPLAFVLITTELGAVDDVLHAVLQIPIINETYMVHSVYDIIARIVADSMVLLRSIISEQIRGIPGIRSTLTS
jgi:DNA-binding Lrp family transcriptional regulator